MSEYQYYGLVAVDRQLSKEEMSYLGFPAGHRYRLPGFVTLITTVI